MMNEAINKMKEFLKEKHPDMLPVFEEALQEAVENVGDMMLKAFDAGSKLKRGEK